jgi:hypothetical protein
VTLTWPDPTVYTNYSAKVKTIQQAVVSATANVIPLVGGAAGTGILAATPGKWAEVASDATNLVIVTAN